MKYYVGFRLAGDDRKHLTRKTDSLTEAWQLAKACSRKDAGLHDVNLYIENNGETGKVAFSEIESLVLA